MTKLSVNLNKFALLRNARGTDFPNVLKKAHSCIEFGVHGITVHPRPDQRHATYADTRDLSELLRDRKDIEFNVEGNPIPEFLKIVEETGPDQCTLVPDDPDQLTSDHGWDLTKDAERVKPIVDGLKNQGIRVSLFMDPDLRQIDLAKESGTDRIELYTEPYANAFGQAVQQDVLSDFKKAALHAQEIGLGVNAGHDLNLDNLGLFLGTIPNILEVSIGHAIVVEAFDHSLKGTIERYLDILASVKK
ncbi:MAG: pyridoxine 5'-phosphate synthase [Proteobacteria bacterium]|nr:pyridoxine 5'-phosphate synthase [Pseudomonadota bacterium]